VHIGYSYGRAQTLVYVYSKRVQEKNIRVYI